MSRILILADLHYRKPWFDWLADNAAYFDAVVLAGDLLYQAEFPNPRLPDWGGGRTPALRLQTDQVGNRLKAINPPFLAACSGNHDHRALFTDYLCGPTACVDAETKHLDPAGIVFTAIPYDHVSDRSSVALDQAWPASPPPVSDFWILLHHVPPLGSVLCPRAQGHHALAARLRDPGARTPDLVCSGHFHFGKPTPSAARPWCERLGASWVLNPGSLDPDQATDCYPTPPHIIADTTARTLVWHCGLPDCAPVSQSLDT